MEKSFTLFNILLLLYIKHNILYITSIIHKKLGSHHTQKQK